MVRGRQRVRGRHKNIERQGVRGIQRVRGKLRVRRRQRVLGRHIVRESEGDID